MHISSPQCGNQVIMIINTTTFKLTIRTTAMRSDRHQRMVQCVLPADCYLKPQTIFLKFFRIHL